MYLKSILHFHRVIEKENFFWRIRTAALIAVFTPWIVLYYRKLNYNLDEIKDLEKVIDN